MGTGRSGISKGIRNTTSKLYKTWQNRHDAEDELRIDIDKWNKVKSQDSHDALYRYTGSYYMTSNPILRAPEHTNLSQAEVLDRITKTEGKSFAKWVKDMDKGLNSYENTVAFVGYRGAGYSLLGGVKTYEQLQAMVGKTVHDPGHMSVSTVRGSEFDRAVMYEIKVPAGKGIGAYVGKLSQHKHEAEFLFNRGTIFKIVKVRKSGSKPIVTLEVYGRY